MSSKQLVLPIVIGILAALGASSTAQDNQSSNPHKHNKYRFVDLGTFGGEESYIADITQSLNNRGAVVGAAETTVPLGSTNNLFVCTYATVTATNVLHGFVSHNDKTDDLGALSPASENCSTPVWLNQRGQIAGVSEAGIVDPVLGVKEIRAVLWEDGHLHNLGTLGGNASFAQAVNNSGQVTGMALNMVPDAFSLYGNFFFGSSGSTQARAFLWRDGRMQDLGTLGGPDAWGIVVNEGGQVAGYSFTNSAPNDTTGIPTVDPFYWDGRMRDVGTLGGVFGLANNMNNRGQIVGLSDLAGDLTYHAFLWDRGVLGDLGTLGGSTSEARWINEAGEVVGAADFAGDEVHDAVLWKNGRMIDLGNLGATSFAHANNDNGQIVGAARLADLSIHAFLWEKGGPMVDLNDLIPPDSSLTLEYAHVINDQGMIGGVGIPPGCNDINDGYGHAFLLIPDGDCNENNEARIAATQERIAAERTAAAQHAATMQQSSESSLTAVDRVRNMMRQRYHLAGQPTAPRD